MIYNRKNYTMCIKKLKNKHKNVTKTQNDTIVSKEHDCDLKLNIDRFKGIKGNPSHKLLIFH